MAEQSLKDKTVKGVGWSAIDNVAQYAVTFLVGIVLARLLTPDDYGLLGIVTIFTSVCTALINGGFSSAIIRKQNVSEDDYNTAFVINIVMSLVLYIVIFFSSPFIAGFFGRDELVALTRVASLGMIIGGLAMVQQTQLTKRIDFKTQTIITLIASITSGALGIVMALIGFGVWALVIQGLVSQTLRSIMLWILNRWMPRFYFSVNSFKELFGFGWKMMASTLIDTVWKELNQVVVGKFYKPAALGQYTRANQFSNLFSSNLTNVIMRVTYPVLSDMQGDKKRMLNAYCRIIKATMLVATVSMFLLGAISEPLLYCLIGPQWEEAATYLPLICIAASAYPLFALNLNMLQVQGRSDLFLGLEIVKKIIAIGPLVIGVFVGIMQMLYAGIIVCIISFFLNSYYSGKLLGYTSWMQLKDILPSYSIATIVALSVFFLKFIPLSYWIVLPLQLIVGMLVFFIICESLKLPEYLDIKGISVQYINKIVKRKIK